VSGILKRCAGLFGRGENRPARETGINASPSTGAAATPGSPTPLADPSPGLSEQLTALHAAFAFLQEGVVAALEKADRSASVIASLESENRSLKWRENERKQEPMIRAFISLFDDLRSVARHAQSDAAGNGRQPADLLQSLLVFERQALEALRRGQVEAFEPTVADPFDPRRQEVGAILETSSPGQEMRIAEVLRPGFEIDGRVIRPASVRVYRFYDKTTLKGDAHGR
jgi:molecular chaperone GrpE (heat shock protein)